MAINVTVFVNSYFRLTFMERALASVLSQDSRYGFEILIVSAVPDYEPSDSIQSAAAKLGIPMRVVVVPPGPVGVGILEGISFAKGRVLAFIDDDDEWASGKLLAVEEAFEDPEVVFFHNSQELIDESGGKLSALNANRLIRHPSTLRSQGRLVKVDTSDVQGICRLWGYEPEFNNSSIALRKDVPLEVLKVIPELVRGEDSFLFFSSLSRPGKLVFTSDRLTRVRIHPAASTSSSGATVLKRFSDYERYIDDQMTRVRLVRRVLSEAGIAGPAPLLAFDEAFWATVLAIAAGRSTMSSASQRSRVLLGSQDLRPRPRELIAAWSGCFASFLPGTTRAVLDKWRQLR